VEMPIATPQQSEPGRRGGEASSSARSPRFPGRRSRSRRLSRRPVPFAAVLSRERIASRTESREAEIVPPGFSTQSKAPSSRAS